ncbi:MAG: S24 family peptidase [Pseudomonadota bacterium]
MEENEISAFIERLELLRGSDSIPDFARRCDVIPNTMKNYFGNSLPSFENLRKIASACNVTTDWLVFGRAIADTTNSIVIPEFDIRASAGNGQQLVREVEATHEIAFSKDFIQRYVALTDNLGIVQGQGDSMKKPDGTGIHDGDMLIVNFSVREHRYDDVYLLDINGFVMVKRLKRLVAGGFEVISDNPDYGRETLSPDQTHDIRVLGHVVWHGHPTR